MLKGALFSSYSIKKNIIHFRRRPRLPCDNPPAQKRLVGWVDGGAVYRGRSSGCGPAGTCQGLTQALCSRHMAFVISHWEKDSPLAPPSLSLPHHISFCSSFPPSLPLFHSFLVLGFRSLKCFSCLLCIKCPPFFTTTRPLNFAVLREKWLSGGKAADAVKSSQTEVRVITGRWWLLIPCEEVDRAGVAETVTPALKKWTWIWFYYDILCVISKLT